MKNNSKTTLKMMSLLGISLIGASTIVVSCGTNNNDKVLQIKKNHSDGSLVPSNGNKSYKFNKEIFSTYAEAYNAKKKYIAKKAGELKISKEKFVELNAYKLNVDSLVINPKEKGVFDKLKLPVIRISGADGEGVLNKPQVLKVDKIILEKKSKNTSRFVHRSNKLTQISNGDIINIIFKKRHSSLIRTIKVTNLKRGVVEFMKSNKAADVVAKKALFNEFQEVGKLIHKDAKKLVDKMLAQFKAYVTTNVNKNKSELVKSIHELHEFIDKRVFDEFIKKQDSLINKLIKTLKNNDIDISSISNNSKTLKPELISVIEEGLDIFKGFIDRAFDFIENSINWNPAWKTQANLIDMNTTNVDDKKFIDAIKNKLLETTGDSRDKKDIAFKTVQKLIKDNFKIYKESTTNKTIYHVVKNVNSRKIINSFRAELNFSAINSKGTIDNLHVIPGGLADKKLKDALAKALARRNNHYKKTNPELKNNTQGRNKPSLDANSILGMINLPKIKALLPSIKNFMNDNSFDELLKIANSVIPGMFGISGMANIAGSFNSISGVVTNSLIHTETNIQGLLTYIFGDEGQVMMDFELKNNQFILIDYKSPQITTIDKKNRTNPIFRNDNLETVFNKLKPIINVGISLLGNI